MKKEFELLEPYSNITDLKIFRYLINNDYVSEEYNEKFNLLSKNMDVLYKLSKNSTTLSKLSSKYRILHEEQLKYYKNILHKTSKLAKELKLENSLELSILFTYLMKKGYFSKNKKHKFSSSIHQKTPGYYGLKLMSGVSCCLNDSYMLKDFLNLNRINCTVIYTNFDQKKCINTDYDYFDFKTNNYLDLINMGIGNHAFNLIKENNKLYVYDSTNTLLFNVINSNVIENEINKNLYSIHPYMVFREDSDRHFNMVYDLFTKKEFVTPYSCEECSEIYSNILDTLKSNKNLLKDYYNDTKCYIKAVAKGIKK